MNRISENKRLFIQEAILRIILIIVFEITDDAVPFHRKIMPEEMWMYSYPKTHSYYPSWLLWTTVWGVPALIFLVFYILKRDLEDLTTAVFGVLLSIYSSGVMINLVKLTVGRPRPDFMERCYPDGNFQKVIQCTGDINSVHQGYKSFPSGHSTLSFASLVYVSLYLAGKLHVFSGRGRGGGLKMICILAPLMWATLIAISRTADYHHHWQDVTTGSVVGLVMAYACYRQDYPAPSRPRCHLPHTRLPPVNVAPLSSIAMGDTHHEPHPLSPDSHSQVTAIMKTL